MNEFNDKNVPQNRFIFSDDFYNQLDVPEEKKVTFDPTVVSSNNIIQESNIEKKENIELENTVVPETTQNEETSIDMDSVFNFFNTTNQVETKQEEVVEETVKEKNTEIPQDKITTLSDLSNFNKEDNETQESMVVEPISIEKNMEVVDVSEKEKINPNQQLELVSQIQSNVSHKASWHEESKEIQTYRATRNKNIEEKNNEIPTAKQIVTNVLPNEELKREMPFYFKTPSIINIDEELAKLQESIIPISLEEIDYDENNPNEIVNRSNLLEELKQKEQQTGKISILARYGEDFCSREYVTNPAIGRKEEIKQLILILLTPEKSGLLVGKAGIGKTSIVEGLAYQLQRNNVPDALKGYRIISVKTTSLLGTLPNGETRLQTLIDELKELDKVILFIDEIHMLMGATSENSLDFANMFKESLGRGSIKMIGATTDEEYETYILRDRAFVRRFQRVDVEEPTKEQTIKILMGTLPKIEKKSGTKLKYSRYIQTEIMSFIVDITTEYKRVYGIGSRYPDICLTLLSQAFSQAVFENREEVNIIDIRNAIINSKNIYEDVIRKDIVIFDDKFKKLIEQETTEM